MGSCVENHPAHGVNDIRQNGKHTAELLISQPSPPEAEYALEKLKRYKVAGTHHILAALIREGGETLCSEINKLIQTEIRNNRLTNTNILLAEEIHYCTYLQDGN
jgi:hypothetical protein